MPIELSHLDTTLALASHGRVQLQSWRGSITIERLRLVEAKNLRYFKQLAGEKMCVLSMGDTDTRMADQAANKFASELLRRTADKQLAAATLIEGDGFKASAARAVLSGMYLLARTPMPHRVFGTIEPATAWFATLLSLAPAEQKALGDAASELRRKHLSLAAG